MNAILLEISDIERRATLQGRYLRAYPKISAPCCKYLKETLGETLDHCFQCSVKWIGSGHEGLTCVQFRASKATQDSIVPCPECGMNLVKGDGCNSVKCVCGHKYNWQQAAVRAIVVNGLTRFDFPVDECVYYSYRAFDLKSNGRVWSILVTDPSPTR